MDELNNTLTSLHLDEFSSAKIKIDQLFFEWLALEGQAVIEAIIAADDLLGSDDEGISSSKISESSSSQAGASHGQGPIPPRSPTNTKKSPKKRTQSEMQNNTNPNVGSGASSSLLAENSTSSSSGGVLQIGGERSQIKPFTSKDEIEKDNEDQAQISARRRSNFDIIPLFYVPGGAKQKDQKLRVRQGMLDKPFSRFSRYESTCKTTFFIM